MGRGVLILSCLCVPAAKRLRGGGLGGDRIRVLGPPTLQTPDDSPLTSPGLQKHVKM